MKRFWILLFLCLLIFESSVGQVLSASIGISGLHCSACSFATEKALRELNFIKEVNMDLNAHVAEITFKEGLVPDFDAMARKVRDAGFSVGSLRVRYNFSSFNLSDNACLEDANYIIQFIGIKGSRVMNGPQDFLLVGSNFMSGPEFKKFRLQDIPPCRPGGVKKPVRATI
jgi:copper chaperone CopZ